MDRFKLWQDRRGRVSILRIVVLAAFVLPLLLAAYAAYPNGLGARPLNDLIHRAGYWALIFLLASLAVTPLRRIARFGALVDVRRMLGVGAFAYAAAHILLYIADLQFDLVKVATEIVLRLYLTIGFVAWLGLAALAATSTDRMMRRLGGARWRRLHQATYVIVLLALIHFFQQTKADVTVPTLFAGLCGWLLLYRVLARFRSTEELSPLQLIGLAVAVAVLTFAAEAIGIGIAYHVSPLRVLDSAFDFHLDTIRPGWFVLAAGLAVALLDLIRSWQRSRPRARVAGIGEAVPAATSRRARGAG